MICLQRLLEVLSVKEIKPKLSVVVPIFNEDEVIGELHRRLGKVLDAVGYDFEVIFVEDGSTDSSFDLLKDLHIKDPRWKVLKFSRNFGHQVAITAGLDAASGDAVVIMDGDLQDPPEAIPELLQKWTEGFDVVHAVRQKRKDENPIRRIISFVFYRLINALAGIKLPLDAGDFRLISKRGRGVFGRLGERARYVRGLMSWVGLKQTSIQYVREGRAAGRGKYGLSKQLRLGLDGITSFSATPLRFASYLGFAISFACLAYAVYVVLIKLAYGYPTPGYASIVVAILFIGGVQLIAIGILGEYVGRLYEEAKHRPLYVIDTSLGFGDYNAEANRHADTDN